jgi:hypothetical protein
LTNEVRLLGFLAVAKKQISIKTNLWVGDFMLKSDGKHAKNHQKYFTKKKEDAKTSLIPKQNFTITP